jgi:hypothetical protein
MSNNEDWVCNSILKNSNNTNIKEFMKNRCGDYEKYKKHTPNKSL